MRIERHILFIENVDIVDGTPLPDIKPYVGRFDGVKDPKTGRLTKASENAKKKKADMRFK